MNECTLPKYREVFQGAFEVQTQFSIGGHKQMILSMADRKMQKDLHIMQGKGRRNTIYKDDILHGC